MLLQLGKEYAMRTLQKTWSIISVLVGIWIFINLSFLAPVRTVMIEGQLRDIDTHALQLFIEDWTGLHMFWQTRPLEQALENNPWVEKASVKRRFPDQISVYLQTRTAIMRWANNQYLMDNHGHVMATSTPSHLSALPIVYASPDAHKQLFVIWEQLRASKHGWYKHVSKITCSEFGDFELVFSNRIKVKLGNKHLSERLHLFMRVGNLWQVLQDQQNHVFDMRYQGSFSHQADK